MREPFQQPFGDHEPQHAVTDEFQAFVGAHPARAGGGAVRQRLGQKLRALKAMAQQRLRVIKAAHRMILNNLSQRISVGQYQNS